jgi:hypothetical protein
LRVFGRANEAIDATAWVTRCVDLRNTILTMLYLVRKREREREREMDPTCKPVSAQRETRNSAVEELIQDADPSRMRRKNDLYR